MEVGSAERKLKGRELPMDWKQLRLGDLRPYVTSGSRGWARYYADTGAPFVRITNMIRSSIYLDLNDVRYVNVPEGESEALRTRLQNGDVLISITADIGIVGFVSDRLEQPAYINQHLALIRFDASSVCSKFIAYLLASHDTQRHFQFLLDSGAKAGMNLSTVQRVPLRIPATQVEQEAIAEALSDMDALIDSMEQLLAKKHQIKQGAMQELLTGKRRLPGFLGNWTQKPLGELLTIRHGKSQAAVEDRNGPYPILATGGRIGWAKDFLYDKPSVLIGRKGTIDQPRFMDSPFWTVDTLFYSIIKHPHSPKFLFYRFCLIPWRQYNEASGVPSLNARTIEQLEIAVPCSEEQEAIAQALSQFDCDIVAAEKKLGAVKSLKQGMMQELLTGRIRLI